MAARVGLLLRALPLLLWGGLDAQLEEHAGRELHREAEVRGVCGAGRVCLTETRQNFAARPAAVPSELTVGVTPPPVLRTLRTCTQRTCSSLLPQWGLGPHRHADLRGFSRARKGGRDNMGQTDESSEKGSPCTPVWHGATAPHRLSRGDSAVHSSDASSPPRVGNTAEAPRLVPCTGDR